MGLVRPRGKDDPGREGRAGREGRHVVRRGEGAHDLDGLEADGVGRTVSLQRLERALELGRGEPVREAVEHGARQIIAGVELGELREKWTLVVVVRRRALTCHEDGRQRVEGQRALGIDGPGAELDGRDVSLSDGPQAHHESSLPIARIGLIGGWNDGRVEQGGALDRILVGEVGADEEPPSPGHGGPAQAVGHERVVTLEQLFEPVVTVLEQSQRPLERFLHLGLGQGEDPLHQKAGARRGVGSDLLAGQVGLGDHAPRIGAQDMRGTPDHHPSYSNPSPARSSISISEIRKDTVLSAPWLTFSAVSLTPSRQPAVAGS